MSKFYNIKRKVLEYWKNSTKSTTFVCYVYTDEAGPWYKYAKLPVTPGDKIYEYIMYSGNNRVPVDDPTKLKRGDGWTDYIHELTDEVLVYGTKDTPIYAANRNRAYDLILVEPTLVPGTPDDYDFKQRVVKSYLPILKKVVGVDEQTEQELSVTNIIKTYHIGRK